jgi:hypothetical protein
MKNIILGFLVVFLGSCVASNPDLMTPSEIIINNNIEGSAQVNVVGSNERIIPNESFRQAVENALLQSGLFTGDAKQYRLNVSVLAIENPLVGVNLTAELRVRWVLFDVDQGQEKFNEVIATEYTATMGDSLLAAQRMTIANENAAKENIRNALQSISNNVE